MSNVTNSTYIDDDAASEDSVRALVIRLNRRRHVTFPNKQTVARKKPRRWPLVFRFVKGAIHKDIAVPVVLHALFTTLIVCLDRFVGVRAELPPSIVPSLSIVVGLMLVFRNQTSYQRFWDGMYCATHINFDFLVGADQNDKAYTSQEHGQLTEATVAVGRNNLTTVITSLRNLTRSFLSCSHKGDEPPSQSELADIERTVRILIAIPSSITNSLRSEWNAAWAPITRSDINKVSGAVTPRLNPDYADLLPLGLKGRESEGLALPVELSFLVESFIKRGHDRGWFHSPQASQLTVQVNTLVDAYGRMETIRNTSYPVAILIHQRQVLALFGAVLPLAIVESSHWWSIPIVSLVMFTLYGIEGIACQLEDPFGYERNDIKMDPIVQDARTELGVMLAEWKSRYYGGAGRDGGGRRQSERESIVGYGFGGREMFLDEI